jgi:serine/threonine-protein kinase
VPILTPQERIGTTLDGKYRIEKILGIGGMGAVYAGTHTITGRRVAVKILHPEHATSADVMERFFREARTASEIKHPNVVDVLDMGTDPDDKTVFLVLELLEGESLARRLKRETKLHYAQAAEVLLPVMRALAFAHGRRVVHRDLKPDNIFIGAEPAGGTVTKLLDFGIAKALDRNESRMTQTGFVLGTPAYMSPEQAAGNPDDITPASDIWSMGVVWYECLTGEMPFEGNSPTATLIAIANGRYHHLRRRMPDLPLAIAHAVDKALAKDPARRHADMDAFIQSLQRALESPDERAVTEPSPSMLQPPETPREHWSFGPPRAFAAQTSTERVVALTGDTEASQRTPPSIVVSTPSPVRRWGLLAGVLGAVALAGTAVFAITYDSNMPPSRVAPSPRPVLARPPAPTPPAPPPQPTSAADASTAATAVAPAPTPVTESESHGSHRARHGHDRHDESPATPVTPPMQPPCALNAPHETPPPATPTPATPTPAPAPQPSSAHEPITTYESTP